MIGSKQAIVEYYRLAEIDYRLVWRLGRNQAMHMGFWTKGVGSLSAALQNQNAVMAKLADIKPTDRVLDAGCGVGGSSIFLASRIGCHVTGISLSKYQVEAATINANCKHLSSLTDFFASDYCDTGLPDQSFDVVWGLESICYAQDKGDFIREAFRLLKPGGRLIVTDGFANYSSYRGSDKGLMDCWLDGWQVPSLATLDQFCLQAQKTGFVKVKSKSFTAEVLPSSRRLYWYSTICAPIDWLGLKLGLRNLVTHNNLRAARHQYLALTKGLWQYAAVSAIKES